MIWLALALACSGTRPDDAPTAPAPAAPAPAPAPAPPPAPELTLEVPSSPGHLGAALAESEAALRDPATPPDALALHGHRQQRIYRELAGDPVLTGATLKALPEAWREVARSNVDATAEIARTVKRPRTDLPPWRIVEPEPAETLLGFYKEAEAEFDVPWQVLAGVHLVETRMGRLRGTSIAGARGPMQFMPKTWEAYGEGDIEDPRDAIMAAGRYLKAMGAPGDLKKALWHYNHTEHYGNAVLGYASVMEADEAAYRGYHAWQVYYRTVFGDLWLIPGYEATERGPIEPYCEKHGEPVCPNLHGAGAPGAPRPTAPPAEPG